MQIHFWIFLIITCLYCCSVIPVYRKPTHTNQYLPFDSPHPVAHKASVVRTLMSRASELSSNGVVRVAEERVVDALKQNGYPLRFIQRHSRSSNLHQTTFLGGLVHTTMLHLTFLPLGNYHGGQEAGDSMQTDHWYSDVSEMGRPLLSSSQVQGVKVKTSIGTSQLDAAVMYNM